VLRQDHGKRKQLLQLVVIFKIMKGTKSPQDKKQNEVPMCAAGPYQCMAQGVDTSVWRTSILDISTHNHAHFIQEYANIMLVIISTPIYIYIYSRYYVFSTLHL
jgi:hypothetical protein